MSDKQTRKEREKEGEVSFVVDRAGVKNTHTGDARTRHHRLPIRYTSTLPVQKLTDHTQETKNESIPTQFNGGVQLAAPLGKRSQNIPRKHPVLRKQLSDRYSTSARRYHVEDDPRFSALKPGFISESLREALGISENQLPLYIYNMRLLGYPPGHLENARRQQSGILIFTNDGCEVTPHGKVLEEGEVNDDEQDQVLFDVDKLIDFPGFNIHPPDGTLDECESLDLPFMQADHSMEEMKRLLLSSALRKESINDADQNLGEACAKERENSPTIHFSGHADSKAAEKTKSYSDEKMAIWLSEMGLNAADGWLVLDSLPELDDDHCEFSTCPNSAVERNSTDRCLPSQQSQNLSVHKMPMPNEANVSVLLDDFLTPEKTSHQALPSSSQGPTVTMELCSDSDFGEDVVPMSIDVEEKKASVYGGSLNVTPGTPFVGDSMFESKGLPDASRFSSGMSEPLPYENLPNATGAFGKLRSVLTAARLKKTRVY